jgi:hypothetical protein
MLQRYKYMFGHPKKGFHKSRWFIFARNDILVSIVAAIILNRISRISFSISLLIVFFIGIVAHLLFKVDTSLNLLLFF